MENHRLILKVFVLIINRYSWVMASIAMLKKRTNCEALDLFISGALMVGFSGMMRWWTDCSVDSLTYFRNFLMGRFPLKTCKQKIWWYMTCDVGIMTAALVLPFRPGVNCLQDGGALEEAVSGGALMVACFNPRNIMLALLFSCFLLIPSWEDNPWLRYLKITFGMFFFSGRWICEWNMLPFLSHLERWNVLFVGSVIMYASTVCMFFFKWQTVIWDLKLQT